MMCQSDFQFDFVVTSILLSPGPFYIFQQMAHIFSVSGHLSQALPELYETFKLAKSLVKWAF